MRNAIPAFWRRPIWRNAAQIGVRLRRPDSDSVKGARASGDGRLVHGTFARKVAEDTDGAFAQTLWHVAVTAAGVATRGHGGAFGQ